MATTVSIGAPATADGFWELPIPAQGEPPALAVELTKSLNAGACGLCHVRQYEQWRGSLHARALGPGLAGQLPAMSLEEAAQCLTCHAPRAEQQERILLGPSPTKPEQAIAALSLLKQAPPLHGGVDCAGCHVRAHRRYGPNETPLTPHGPVTALPKFRQSDFCAPCHQFPEGVGELAGKPLQNTHEEWAASRQAAEGIGCQDCHMPDGSHAFRGIHDPEMTRRALRIVLTRTAHEVQFTVTNTGAGHAVPTYATPRIRLQLQSNDDPNNRIEHLIQRTLVIDPDEGLVEQADTRLMTDQSVTLQLAVGPAEAATGRILVEPDAFYHDEVYPTLLAELPREEHRQRRLLEQALRESGASSYVLYEADCGAWGGQEITDRSHPTTDREAAETARLPPQGAAGSNLCSSDAELGD
jgi:hypothetical protein